VARALRIEYPAAIYHVMARGNQGQPIYADDGDRKLWLCTLASRVCQQNSRISLRNLVYVDIMNARTPNTLLPSTGTPNRTPTDNPAGEGA